MNSHIAALDVERIVAVSKLREAIVRGLPAGFEEQMTSIPNYVVPLETYPQGYHTVKNTPLPFISFASQKNYIALYHFGLYVDTELMAWFIAQYAKHVDTKLNMGKSCIRFRKPEQIPFELIAQMCAQRDTEQWIARYEKAIHR